MSRRILIVDDNELNRAALRHILSREYEVMEAENGKEALDILHRRHKLVSAVVLDISMPVMDGYELLTRMRSNAVLSQIPVIIATGSDDKEEEVRSLSRGANGFITKPYDPALILSSLRNTISLRENASIINAIQRDKLTGLYNREAFFDKAEAMIREREPGSYIMSCFDIDNFKLINDQYGAEEGDRILRHIGRALRAGLASIGGIGGRIAADNFAALFPVGEMELDRMTRLREKELSPPDTRSPIVFSAGRYVVSDLSLSVSAAYDRAYLAKQSVKGRYDRHTEYFSEFMREKLLREQEIVGEMDSALVLRQFELWFQPKINHSNGALIGAEALVRWRHPERGLIAPDRFIPVFERNGFIYELDKYVWEQACIFLRKWMDAGWSPCPISVNISRYDLFRTDMIETVTGLLKRYDIPVELLHLEITESAFAKSTEQIIDAVKRLMNYGLTMEIDDFGSGYSSLNTLKDVPANILKLDIRFLESAEDMSRGGSIMESVVRMAKWLGMSVIAEGVETREQADFLSSIGCNYVQGYLYSRPMPASEYEELVKKAGTGEKAPSLLPADTSPPAPRAKEPAAPPRKKGERSLEDKREALLENLPCGAGIYEIENGSIRATYLNKRYRAYLHRDIGDLGEAPVFEVVHPQDVPKLRDALQSVISHGGEGKSDIRIMDGKGGYIYFRLVGTAMEDGDKRSAIYVTFTPISREELTYSEMLPVALAAVIGSSPDLAFVKDRNYRYVCCSESFAKLAGLPDAGEIAGKTDYDLLEKPVADRYRAGEEELIEKGLAHLDYDELLPTRDGSVRYGSTVKYPLLDSGGSPIGIYSVTRDVTRAREADSHLELLAQRIPGGLATYACTGGVIKLTHFNDGFCALFGFTREEYERKSRLHPVSMIFDEYRPKLDEQLRVMLSRGTPMDLVYRAHVNGGGYKWISHKAVVAGQVGSTVIINAVLLDITKLQEATERLRISEEENRLAVKHSGAIICRFSVAERAVTVSPEVAAAFSLPERIEEVPFGPILHGMISPESAEAYASLFDRIVNGEASGSASFQKMTGNGWRWFDAYFSTIFSAGGQPVSAVISYTDVTERREKEAVYKRWQQSLQEKAPGSYTLFRSNLSKDVSFDTMEGSLLTFDFSPESTAFNERTAEYAKHCVAPEDSAAYIAALDSDTLLASYYRGKRTKTLEYREVQPDGGVLWRRLTVELAEYPNSTDVEAYLMYEDIDETKRAELLTLEQAETDPLTGLLNRRTLSARVDDALRSSPPGTCHALLMLDMDGFKRVNDVFGHGAGDKTLIDTAAALRSALRRNDLPGRLGGDEFIVFLRDIPGESAAAGKARQICALLRRAISPEVRISASVGIALYPRDGEDFAALYKKADDALYRVKSSGKDGFALYGAENSECGS